MAIGLAVDSVRAPRIGSGRHQLPRSAMKSHPVTTTTTLVVVAAPEAARSDGHGCGADAVVEVLAVADAPSVRRARTAPEDALARIVRAASISAAEHALGRAAEKKRLGPMTALDVAGARGTIAATSCSRLKAGALTAFATPLSDAVRAVPVACRAASVRPG